MPGIRTQSFWMEGADESINLPRSADERFEVLNELAP